MKSVSVNLPSGNRTPSGEPAGSLPDLAVRIAACGRCPRLRTHCTEVARRRKRAHADEVYWGRPVPGFGDPNARLLLVGLAPAAHGANRTGRPFTGDGTGGSADFLMAALHRAGFASGPTSTHRDDGLVLRDAYMSIAVRCAPPDNKPLPEEFERCLPWLREEFALLPRTRVVLALGQLAFNAWLQVCRELGQPVRPKPAFGHEEVVEVGGGLPVLIGSYHPSRQNTNTGRLTPAMLDDVLALARSHMGARRRVR